MNFAPIIGPLLAAFGGPLLKGLKALGGKLWGALKGMFGGPGAAELEARRIGSSLNAMLASVLTEQDKVIAGNEQWKISNIGVNRIYEAAGKSMAEAAAMATRLSDSVRMTPAEAQKVIDEIQAVYDAGIGAIGDTADAVVTTVTETAEQVAAATAAATATATDTAVRDATRFGDAYVNAGDRITKTFRGMRFDVPVNFDVGSLGAGVLKGLGGKGEFNTSGKGFGVPFLAHGALVTGPMLAVVGESGKELVVPPEVTSLLLDAAARRGSSPNGGVTIGPIVINNPTFTDPLSMRRQTRQFLDQVGKQVQVRAPMTGGS